jgi:aspartyl-tRNA(Asn)/glutamyl-tRNA(Gln) amidotransferase subunit A
VASKIDTLRLTAEEAMVLLERGEVSAEELHGAYLEAIASRDGEIHAYLKLVEECQGTGVPIAIKDVITTEGIETTAGSKILAGYVPVFDSTVAAKLKQAGLALGSDTGGSIKQPASLCGLVGLRPTYGTVSRYGIIAFASSLDQVGPITKTVRDCALLYSIIAGRDPLDSTTVEPPEPVELPDAEDMKGLRIGLPKEMNEAEGITPGVKAETERAIALCRELGAEVEECSLPLSIEYGLACYYLIAPAEASSNLARFDGVRYGHRAKDARTLIEVYERSRDEGFGDEPKRRIMIGTYALSAGYYDAFYGQAQKVRTIIAREHAALFERFDLIISPTSPTVAFKLGEKTHDPLAMYASDVLTIPPNMAGLPGLSIPSGLSEGLPVGLQLTGPQFSENVLFSAAHALEQALEFDFVPPRLKESA